MRMLASSSSESRRAYQMSSKPILANPAIACRYAVTASSVAAHALALLNPLFRAQIVKLAASRFTSYSNGPGKRLVEIVDVEQQQPLRRSERAEVRQMRVAAQLHVQPGRRRVRQIGGHDLRRTPIEGERGRHHPTVPHRNQVRVPGGILRLEQGHRIRTIRCRYPAIMSIWWCSRPRVLTVRSPLSNARVCDRPPSHATASRQSTLPPPARAGPHPSGMSVARRVTAYRRTRAEQRACEEHGRGAIGFLRDGQRCALSGGISRTRRTRRGVPDRSASGDERRVPALRAGHGLPHDGRDDTVRPGLSRRGRSRPRCRVTGIPGDGRAGPARRLAPVVALDAGRALAGTGRTGQRARRKGAAPGRARVLRGRPRLRGLGR